jgi:dUTP pyrophosphatase
MTYVQENIVKFKFTTQYEPKYHTIGSSCADISCFGDHIINKNNIVKIPTGIYLEYLDPNYELQILSRSGLTLNGLIVLNSPGIIDSDYRGEIFVILYNIKQRITIKDGDRIAQMKISPIYKIPNLKTFNNNDHNGFGSTGINDKNMKIQENENKKREYKEIEEQLENIENNKKNKYEESKEIKIESYIDQDLNSI